MPAVLPEDPPIIGIACRVSIRIDERAPRARTEGSDRARKGEVLPSSSEHEGDEASRLLHVIPMVRSKETDALLLVRSGGGDEERSGSEGQ